MKIIALLLALIGFIYFAYHHKPIQKEIKLINQVSEDASEIYKGKVKQVYNPLDKAWDYSDQLKQKIQVIYDNTPGWYVVSLWIDEKDLYDENRGIWANSQKRGKLWERAAHMHLFKDGYLLKDSIIGLRIHGGSSRRASVKLKSFRAYFYDQDHKTKYIEFEGKKMRKMVIRKPAPLFFANDFSYSLFKAWATDLAPQIYPAKVYLNGVFYGHMFLSSHQAKDQLALELSEKDFLFYKLKSDNNTQDHLLFEKAINRIKYARDLNLKNFEKHFDIDDIIKNLIINIYLGSQDWPQGSFYKLKGGKWKIIPWDFDTAFMPPYRREEKNRIDQATYLFNPYKSIQQYYTATFRWYFFNKLVLKSPEFKDRFLKLLDDFIQFVQSEKSPIASRLSHYKKLARATNHNGFLADIEKMEDFTSNRLPVLCSYTKDLFKIDIPSCNSIVKFNE